AARTASARAVRGRRTGRRARGQTPPERPSARRRRRPGALAGGEDGLEVVRALLAGAADHLAPGGVLLLGMHREQCDAAAQAARASGRLGAVDRVLADDDSTAVLRVRARPPRNEECRRAASLPEQEGCGPSMRAGDRNRTRVISLED